METALASLAFAAGLFILIKASDYFIEGAAFMARHFLIPESIIGLTLVSMGTSMPELASDVYASYRGNSLLAVGDIVGSNITNLALVLAIGIIATKGLHVPRPLAMRDGAVMAATAIIFSVMARDGLGRIDAIVLLLSFFAYFTYLFHAWEKRDIMGLDIVKVQRIMHFKGAVMAMLFGGLAILAGSRILIEGILAISRILEVPEGVIGATIMAFGTSVPELAVTLAGVVKGHQDISLGNIVGSNIFNITWIMGLVALVRPTPPDGMLLSVNIPAMLITTLALAAFMMTHHKLPRWQGIFLLLVYAAFLGINVTFMEGLP